MSKYITKPCIVCGKEITVHNDPYTLERRNHCSRKCAGVTRLSKTRKTKPCEHCGKEFGLNLSHSNLEKAKYCSSTCAANARPPREKDPSKRSIFTCQWCGKEFEGWTYRQPTMCSKQCSSEAGAHVVHVNGRPAQRRPENFVTLNCEVCGKEYTVHKLYTEKRRSRFCSVECRGIETSQRMQGAGNHNYKGGTEFYDRGSSWSRQRKQALKRDGCKCQICGYKPRIGAKHKIDVHHIIPYKEFKGDHVTANELSNLITLCRKCHVQVEHYGLPCPKRLL